MNKLLTTLCLFLALLAAPAFGAITEVPSQRAQTNIGGNAASRSVAFPFNVTAGNLLCVGGDAVRSGSVISSVSITDTRGTNYSVYNITDFATLGVGVVTFIACGKAPSSGANTVTVDPDIDAWISFAIDEFTGQDASTFLDADGGGNYSSDTTPSEDVLSVTTGALILGVVGLITDYTGTITEDGGWTVIAEAEDAASYQAFSFIFKIATTPNTYTAGWTIADYYSNDAYSYAIAIKPAGAALAARRKPIIFE